MSSCDSRSSRSARGSGCSFPEGPADGRRAGHASVRALPGRGAVAARLMIVALAGAATVLPGCTARPLYASAGTAIGEAGASAQLASLRGRIAVAEGNSRTDQLVRNALLSRLNQGARVAQPLYEVRLAISGDETGLAIEPNGQLSSSLYRLTATYTVVKLAGGQAITTGTRTETVPFDRTSQLFQAQRALLDARQQAADALAARLEIPISLALEKAGG